MSGGKPTTVPDEVRRNTLMVCIGGPRAGGCYFETYGPYSWRAQVELAAADPTPGNTFDGYLVTEEWVNHPSYDGIRVRVYRWGGDRGDG